MATMVKEKRREKKKSKNKHLSELKSNDNEKQKQESLLHDNTKDKDNPQSTTSVITEEPSISRDIKPDELTSDKQVVQDVSTYYHVKEQQIHPVINKSSFENNTISTDNRIHDMTKENNEEVAHIVLSEHAQCLEHEITLDPNTLPSLVGPEAAILTEDITVPSAPLAPVEIEIQPYVTAPSENVMAREKITCMPIEEAVRVFGGKEIAEVKALSKKEEAIVELGPKSGPDHPLVDLLSTFRTSLISIERERNSISSGYVNEEKSRATLWKVDKHSITVSQKCPCGADVSLRAAYEVARLQTEKMPAAKLRLESLLRDVQECYCHHQHAALQAHYDVDQLLAEIVNSNKGYVREALLIVLQALQLSDSAPEAYAQALQRWASILSFSLLDQRNLGHLLFLLHCLFRQTRSVQWAGRVIALHVPDMPAAARLVAILELLLIRPLLEEAQECTEECEAWEELDNRGEGGAVGEGRFRERDLLALLEALPLQDMIARILLFVRTDIAKEDEQSWGDRSGGHGVLKAGCGVRALLGVLQRGLQAHAAYARLRARLRRLAAAALAALASLHQHCRHTYGPELRASITAELQACFTAGFHMLQEEAHTLPATLLSDDVARDYCSTLITGLHDEGPLRVESLSVWAAPRPCALRVRAVTQAALDRELDHELAETVLEFLFQVGIKRISDCKGSCGATARELLPRLLARRRLHAAALHRLADLNTATALEPELLRALAPQQWRPTPGELRALLGDWAARCAPLVPQLLLQLDYTPHTGVSLESQLFIGSWLCAWLHAKGEAPEWAWQVLRALRVHRTQWGLPLDAPPAEHADDLLSTAYALLASDWGHCLPLACGPGADGLWRLARARPADALRCAAPLMRLMAQSPESVSLTPKLAEVFALILNSGPSLVQRALGRRASSGQELLQQLLTEQALDPGISKPERAALLSAWLHALWRPSVPAGGRAALDAAVRASCEWRTLDAHAAYLLQEENANEYLTDAVRNVSQAPLLCESILRHAHAVELQTQVHARLAAELAKQRAAAQKIHVDNALKQIGSSMTDAELAIHRCACAALAAGPQHPAHLLLWRLLMHMFLQRLPSAPSESAPPVGPLFFSGLVKSRTLSQLKKRLQEVAIYHRAQIEVLKTKEGNIASPSTSESSKEKKSSLTFENNLFSTLAIFDLTGVSDSESDGSLSDRDSNITIDRGARETSVDRDTHNLISYHSAAEKIAREYSLWLEEGEKVRATPVHADVARFLSEQALETAWRTSLDRVSPPAEPPPGPRPESSVPLENSTHCERAIRAIADLKSKKRRRYKMPDLPTIKDDTYFTDTQFVVGTIQKHLTELEKLTRDWMSDLDRVSKLDAQLWELVSRHRVCRPLPPVRKACPQGCAPLTIHIAKDEWCISTGAEQGIHENRRRARAAVRRLSRPRPQDAQVTSRLLSIARRIRNQSAALRVVELAAGAASRTESYAPAREGVRALVADIASRFICADVQLAAAHLARWGAAGGARRELCPLLVRPARVRPRDWPALYCAVLRLQLPPHVTFSYMSKFDLSEWADAVETIQRTEVLESLEQAAHRMGPQPDDQNLMLLELAGVHSWRVARGPELCAHVLRCAQLACARGGLPPLYLQHLAAVVDGHGDQVDFDQLGHLLRQLSVIFWTARNSGTPNRALFIAYAPHFADAMSALLRAFVAAAVRRTYEPVRVSAYAWAALCEVWSAWVLPHGSAPLLEHPSDACDAMLARFGDTIVMIMQECPGCENALLRQVFEWAVRTHACTEQARLAGDRAHVSALLARLAALPWQRQWFSVQVLELCCQVSRSTDPEFTSWCSSCLQHQQTFTWIQDASEEHLPTILANLLDLFTSKQLSLPHEALERARRLPWRLLGEAALAAALARYFAEHHAPARPYHRAPHFTVLLAACQLTAEEGAEALRLPQAADKRALAVSQWVRAASAPALAAHVADHSAYLLRTLSELAPHIEENAGELEQLLSRAVAVLCVEPAASAALPAWLRRASAGPPRLRRALAAAGASLTAQPYFAALGDAVAKAILAEEGGGGWREVYARWAQCAWWEGGELVARGGLHAAYAMLLARPHSSAHLQHALGALLAADVNFVDDEVIVAVWICVAGRAAVRPGAAGAEGERAARALLARWAEQRRTLLQVVTLHAAHGCPTPQQRLLLRLAQCVAAPSEPARRAYELACEAAGAAHAQAWARAPRPALLPRLAASLYPRHEVYFKEELEMAADLD